MRKTAGSKNKQPTVRLNAPAKEKLDRMQVQTDLSQPALMDRAIELLERELMAGQMKADFAAIANHPETLKRYNSIASVFDGAVHDGIVRE